MPPRRTFSSLDRWCSPTASTAAGHGSEPKHRLCQSGSAPRSRNASLLALESTRRHGTRSGTARASASRPPSRGSSVRPSLLVVHRLQVLPALPFEDGKLDLHPGARPAVRRVEHVGRDPAHHSSPASRSSRPRVMWPICSSALSSSLSSIIAEPALHFSDYARTRRVQAKGHDAGKAELLPVATVDFPHFRQFVLRQRGKAEPPLLARGVGSQRARLGFAPGQLGVRAHQRQAFLPLRL